MIWRLKLLYYLWVFVEYLLSRGGARSIFDLHFWEDSFSGTGRFLPTWWRWGMVSHHATVLGSEQDKQAWARSKTPMWGACSECYLQSHPAGWLLLISDNKHVSLSGFSWIQMWCSDLWSDRTCLIDICLKMFSVLKMNKMCIITQK